MVPAVLSLAFASACSGGDGSMGSGSTSTITTASTLGSTSGDEPSDDTIAGPTGPTSGEASAGGVKLDVAVPPDFPGDGACGRSCQPDEAGQAGGDWLLHIREDVLYLVEVADGSKTALCEGIGTSVSLTFTRDNRLFSSTGGALFEIDPCNCTASEVGQFPPGFANIYGIAPDDGDELFGVSGEAEALVRIDTQTAQTTVVAQFEFDVVNNGATWSEMDQALFLLTAGRLYTVDIHSGVATEVGLLDVEFTTVGLEEHPATGLLYGCTEGGLLYEIDKATAQTTLVGTIEDSTGCTNLGAPWSDSDVCLPIPVG
jgi:hypothetical protein